MTRKKQPEKKQRPSDAKQSKENVTDELSKVLNEIVEEPAEPEKIKGEVVTPISDTDFMIGARQYKLVANHREAFDPQRLGERFSDVLARYDYIVGDWGYEQLRLKGFFEADNRKALPDQRIDTLEDYLYEFCNFGCAYFVIQRVGGKKEKTNNSRRRRKKPSQSNQQAHVSEKREDLSKKKKPVIKNRDNNKPKKETKKNQPKTSKKGGFTIRQREE